MKKRVFHIAILIVLMNVLSPVLAVGEEGIFQNNSVLTQLGFDSYTWTEDWIIVAHGYKYREDSDVLGINCYPEDHYSLTLYDRNEKVSRILAADIPAVDLVIKLDIIRFMRLTSWVLFDIDCLFSFWFSLPNCIFLQLSLGFMLLETHSSLLRQRRGTVSFCLLSNA